jgi:hypothetical protein
VTHEDLQAMLKQSGEESLYVQRFPVRELARDLASRDWIHWLCKEVRRFQSTLGIVDQSEMAWDPLGVMAAPAPQDCPLAQKFPNWFLPFEAGKLFEQRGIWHETFASCGARVPGRLEKWLREGYS